MSEGSLVVSGYSTFDVRVRAVRAVIEDGLTVTDVAHAYGTDRSTIHRWLKRFSANGEQGLARKPVPGQPRKVAGLDSESLIEIVLAPASVYGYETDFWTTRRLIQVIWSEFGVAVSKQTVLRRLHEAGLSYQKPEREYFELSEEKRAEWRRKELPRIRRAVRKYKAILYFQDEANVSLTALLGKTWGRRGFTPKQRVTGNRGGVSAMSAITHRGQLIFRLHDKRIASDEVIDFLGQMLRHHPKRHLVVVMDQAPPHVSKKTMAYIEKQRRLHVFHLPTYSPDWNPDEKVWNHLKQHELKGHQAKTKAELKLLTERKLMAMSAEPSLLQGIFFRCCVADALAI
ncbi:MAG TPA: IS630 family transposase [Gemmataceae bacterium]|jgi:transposase|nr:IS630 family transposase [Gemmataceae bacterium]